MTIPGSLAVGAGTADGVERARTALQLRRPDAAEREARGVLAHDPQDPAAHALLALAVSALDRPDEALAEASEAVRLAPDAWFPHFVAGHILLRANRAREGLQAAWAALRIAPERAPAWELAARLHLKLKQWWLAAQAAQWGLAHNPQDSDLASLESLALTELANAPEAMALAADAVRRDPEQPLAHLAAGHAALVARDPGAAAQEFREALRLDPGNEHAVQWLVVALKQGDPVFRVLFRGLRGIGKRRLILPIGLWVILFGVLAVGHWTLWTADAADTLRLARSPYHRLLLRRREITAAWLSAGAVAAGLLTFAAGVAFRRADLASAGVATAALVTPIQETCSNVERRRRMILGGWTVLLALATGTVVAGSAVAPSAVTLGVPLALLAFLTVWPAQWARRLGRQQR